jgi:hypothetical protein
MCDRLHLIAAEDKAFKRLRRRADGLATQNLRQCNEIMNGMPMAVSHQTLSRPSSGCSKAARRRGYRKSRTQK